jgi:uncharacterized membrane protein
VQQPINPAPETVRAYLDALRRALKGAAPALIQDALSDAEEHLRNEVIQHPSQSEREVLFDVIETYGTPEEVAETYITMEAAIAGPFPKQEEPAARRNGFFDIISDSRAYGALVYMLLSLVTGIFYFTWTVTGLALSVGLFILIIGVPFALLFMGSERLISLLEGRIVETLLGVRMPRRLPAENPQPRGLLSRIGDALTDARTWSSMLYLLLMLPLGVIYFTLAVVGLASSIGMTAASLYGLFTGEVTMTFDDAPALTHVLHTAPGLALTGLIGIFLFFVVLHAAKAIGWMHGKLAEALLVRV